MAPRNRKGGGGKGGGGGGGGRQGGGDSRRRADAKPQLLKWVAVAVASLWVGGALWWTMSEADVDRLSSIIDGAVPAGKPVTQENGAAIAEALDLRGLVQNIVESEPCPPPQRPPRPGLSTRAAACAQRRLARRSSAWTRRSSTSTSS